MNVYHASVSALRGFPLNGSVARWSIFCFLVCECQLSCVVSQAISRDLTKKETFRQMDLLFYDHFGLLGSGKVSLWRSNIQSEVDSFWSSGLSLESQRAVYSYKPLSDFSDFDWTLEFGNGGHSAQLLHHLGDNPGTALLLKRDCEGFHVKGRHSICLIVAIQVVRGGSVPVLVDSVWSSDFLVHPIQIFILSILSALRMTPSTWMSSKFCKRWLQRQRQAASHHGSHLWSQTHIEIEKASYTIAQFKQRRYECYGDSVPTLSRDCSAGNYLRAHLPLPCGYGAES